MIEELEEKYGFKLEDLNPVEKETFFKMLEDVSKSQITLEKWREYIVVMRDAVEQELENEPEFKRIFIFKFENRKQILLKARLRNYRLMEGFLISPEVAKQRLENAVAGLVPKK